MTAVESDVCSRTMTAVESEVGSRTMTAVESEVGSRTMATVESEVGSWKLVVSRARRSLWEEENVWSQSPGFGETLEFNLRDVTDLACILSHDNW